MFVQAETDFGKGCLHRRVKQVLTVWERGGDTDVYPVPSLETGSVHSGLRRGQPLGEFLHCHTLRGLSRLRIRDRWMRISVSVENEIDIRSLVRIERPLQLRAAADDYQVT